MRWWEGERKRVLEPQICKLADANVLRSRKFGKRLKSNEENRIWSVAMACAEVSYTMPRACFMLFRIMAIMAVGVKINYNVGSVFAKLLVYSRTSQSAGVGLL